MRKLIKNLAIVLALSAYAGNSTYASATIGYPDSPSFSNSLGGYYGGKNSQKYLNNLEEQTRATKLLAKKMGLKDFWGRDDRLQIGKDIETLVSKAMVQAKTTKELRTLVDEAIDGYAKNLKNEHKVSPWKAEKTTQASFKYL